MAVGYRDVVGTLQKWPAKAGGRSPKGPAVAGTTVYPIFYFLSQSYIYFLFCLTHDPSEDKLYTFYKINMNKERLLLLLLLLGTSVSQASCCWSYSRQVI